MTVEQEISKPEITTGYLYDIHWKDTYGAGEAPVRLCDWGEQLSYGGNIYEPAYIKRSHIKETTDGSSNNVTVTVGNLDRGIQTLVEDYDLVGRDVRQIQWFSNTSTVRVFFWKIASVKCKEDVAVFTLGTNLDLLRFRTPGRKLNARFCPWQFKGADGYCKYSGSDTSCEKTWEDCRKKGNTMNFGGAPGIVTSHFYF